MEHRISSTELARRLGDVLGRVRYRGDSFLVDRSGEPVARVVPVAERTATSLREAIGAWNAAAESDPAFGADLARIGELDEPASLPWDS
jgi:prevent-host-death family protein